MMVFWIWLWMKSQDSDGRRRICTPENKRGDLQKVSRLGHRR